MNRTIGNKYIPRGMAIVAASLGLWISLVLFFAVPALITSASSWRRAFALGVSFWALWLFFLPVVAWLSFRFPIERRRVVRNVSIHLAACLVVVVASRTAFHAAHDFPRAMRFMAPQPPGFRAGLDILLYWSVVGVCQAVTNFRRSQERERRAAELEARLTSAKLQALRMQINPHFLFNTLNSIAALVYVNPRAADEMLGDLSELLRRSFDSMEEHEIPLAQELEFIGAYLRIEQKRFGERLRLEQNIPDELMKVFVPALILQPLVENSIRHGLEPQRGPGLISIEARNEKMYLHLIVRDNGKGFPETDSNNSGRRDGSGIGLANTKARLRELYGSDQNFTITSAEPQGCQVDIRLPLHWEPVHVRPVLNEAVV